MGQFVISMFKKRKDILKYHDTISSFCACKHGWENRFLLIFTLAVSASMLCMHFEEYNGRVWMFAMENEALEIRFFVIFIFECLCIVVFPFVGIFYCEGKHPDPKYHNKDYECPYGNCSIRTSEKFHRCGAYLFLLGLCCTSIVWGVFFLRLFEDTYLYGLAVFCMTWAVLQLLGGIVFVVLQIVLTKHYRIKEAFQSPELFRAKTQLDLELDAVAKESDDDGASEDVVRLKEPSATSQALMVVAEDEECDYLTWQQREYTLYEDKVPVGREQEKYRLIATKLRYVSFAVEGLVAASVIMLVTMNTIIRMLYENEIFGSRSG